MAMRRFELYKQELAAGLSVRQIADKHGVSYQAVSSVVRQCGPRPFKTITEKQCVYPLWRYWMNKMKVGRVELLDRMNMVPGGQNIANLTNYMRGANYPNKQYIDRLLKVTGLTYEELFWREEDEQENAG